MFRIVCLGLLLLVGNTALARSYDDVKESGQLVIGVYRDFPPYSFQDDQQNPVGIDVEIGQKIARNMGLEPVIYWITPDESVDADLRNYVWRGPRTDPDKRVADVMMRVPYDRRYAYAMDSYGLPKHEFVVMYGAYHREEWVIARNTEVTGEVRNLANFMFDKIAVEVATVPDYYLVGYMRGRLRDNVVHFNSSKDAAAAFARGEVAAVTGMRSEIQWGLRDSQIIPDVSTDGLEGVANRSWDIGVASHSNYRQLGYAIGDEINRLLESGDVAKTFAKYGVDYNLPSTLAEEE